MSLKTACNLILISCFFQCGPPAPEQAPKDSMKPEVSLVDIRNALKNENANQRALAVSQVLTYNYREATEEVLTLLQTDSDERVKSTAAIVLATFNEKKALPYIVNELKGKPKTPDFFIESFSYLAENQNCEVLVPYLISKNKVTRLKTIAALENSNCSKAGPLILKQAEKFKANIPILQNHFSALGKIKYKPAGNFILNQLNSLEAGPALAAALLALGRVNNQNALTELVEATGGSFAKGRENAAESLILLQNEKALPGIFAILENNNQPAFGDAVRVIIGIQSDFSGKKAHSLLMEQQRFIYSQLGMILGPLKYKPAIPTIVDVLKNQKNPGREQLARSLGWMQDQEQVPFLIDILTESTGEGRYGAAWSLGVLQAKEALPELEKLSQSKDKKLQMLAIEALAMIASPSSAAALKAQLQEDNPMVPFAAAALTGIQTAEALSILIDCSKKSAMDVRRACINALGNKKEPTAIKHLVELAQTARSEDLNLIFNALKKTTGENFRSRNNWKAWYQSEYRPK